MREMLKETFSLITSRFERRRKLNGSINFNQETELETEELSNASCWQRLKHAVRNVFQVICTERICHKMVRKSTPGTYCISVMSCYDHHEIVCDFWNKNLSFIIMRRLLRKLFCDTALIRLSVIIASTYYCAVGPDLISAQFLTVGKAEIIYL